MPIEFEHGSDCEADRLRNANITTLINESGWRLWGDETSDIDTIWRDLSRVRVFDRIALACQKGVFWAIDHKASKLAAAKRSVSELLRGLVGAEVLLGYRIEWSAKNTNATITAGKFYLDVYMQDNPNIKQLTLDFIYTDEYSSVLSSSI